METGYFNKETARELRIGNIVKLNYSDDWFELDFDNLRSIYAMDSEVYDRVPLSEYWLLKFGAIKKEKGFDLFGFFIESSSNNFYFGHEWEDYRIPLNYIHELQNIYFDLMSNYLTIQE